MRDISLDQKLSVVCVCWWIHKRLKVDIVLCGVVWCCDAFIRYLCRARDCTKRGSVTTASQLALALVL